MTTPLPGKVLTTHGFPSHDASQWLSVAMRCGAIAGQALAEADLVIVPSEAHAERAGIVNALPVPALQRVAAEHRVRHIRSVEVPPPRRPGALKGYRFALFGGFRNIEALTACAQALGGEIAAAPSTDANALVFGQGLDGVPQRLVAMRADGRCLPEFSEPEFFDLVEPSFSPFPADPLQRQLARRLLGLPDPPPSPFRTAF